MRSIFAKIALVILPILLIIGLARIVAHRGDLYREVPDTSIVESGSYIRVVWEDSIEYEDSILAYFSFTCDDRHFNAIDFSPSNIKYRSAFDNSWIVVNDDYVDGEGWIDDKYRFIDMNGASYNALYLSSSEYVDSYSIVYASSFTPSWEGFLEIASGVPTWETYVGDAIKAHNDALSALSQSTDFFSGVSNFFNVVGSQFIVAFRAVSFPFAVVGWVFTGILGY